ncbi:hypothetical protein ABZP36_007038 [Zizania latifolia]
MATAAGKTKHVVLFPFPGRGHLASFLTVARLLRATSPDVRVTLVSTPRNVAALRARCWSDVVLHALPFVPANHDLPVDFESTSSLPLPEFITLFEAFESLEPAFDDFVFGMLAGGRGTVCVVADAFLAWTVRVARRRGCGHAFFLSCGALGTAVLHALWNNMPALLFAPDDGLLHLPEHPQLVLHRTQVSHTFLDARPGMDRWTAYHRRQILHGYRTDAVLINTVEGFEPTGLAMVRRTIGEFVPVWPIGPLVRNDEEFASSEKTMTDDAVLSWLDTQRLASVLYISFGSQNSIQLTQMTELAAALESTGRPFVWAIRPPVGFDINSAFRDEWLPEGFEARASAASRGFLVRGWAPQVNILAHASTGAFVTHCGWNSVLESLTRGVPVVGWPVAAEQFYNAKMLEEWGVCLEVARGNLESSAVDRSKVAAVVEMVMGDTAESAGMRRRVREVQELMKRAWAEDGGSSRTALLAFLTAMRLTHDTGETECSTST